MAIKIKDIIRGNSRVINMTFLQSDGSPADLTGAKVFFAATSESAPSDDSSAAIDVTPVTAHTAPTLGQSRVVLTDSDTRITPGVYNCGAQAVLADGSVIEDTGRLTIKPDYKVATS